MERDNMDDFLEDFMSEAYSEQIEYELNQPDYAQYFPENSIASNTVGEAVSRKAFKNGNPNASPSKEVENEIAINEGRKRANTLIKQIA